VNEQSWFDARTRAGTASLFGHFRAHDWQVRGAGKIFYRSASEVLGSDWHAYWQPSNYVAWNRDDATDVAVAADGQLDFGPSENAGLSDQSCTDWIVDQLQSGAFDAGGGFLALGLNRPHPPHSVLQEWFDRYPERVPLPLGYWPGAVDLDGNRQDQMDLGPISRRRINRRIADRLTQSQELNAFLRAYYASTSFADAQLGRVLDAIEARGLLENTYIVVASDHGYMLGEKRDFTKFDLHEIALRVPLFISGPGIRPQVVTAPVSLVDLYPTLCGLAGLPVPAHCDGLNLASALLAGQAPPRAPVLSYYGFRAQGSRRLRLYSSVRTPQWRLITYGWPRSRTPAPVELREEVELYDHDAGSAAYDPHEWFNVAGEHPEVVAMLRELLPTETGVDLILRELTVNTSGPR
jgi:arylsulfatase A-like enzyme